MNKVHVTFTGLFDGDDVDVLEPVVVSTDKALDSDTNRKLLDRIKEAFGSFDGEHKICSTQSVKVEGQKELF